MFVTLLVATSVDGFIAQTADQRSLDWTSKEDKAFFVAKTKEVGTVIMGRKTFETFGKPLKDRRLIVMSCEDRVSGEGVEWTKLPPKDLLQKLESEGVKQVVVAGGSHVYTQFLKEKLIDELFVTVEPVLFGKGVSFLADVCSTFLQLESFERLGKETMIFHYRVQK